MVMPIYNQAEMKTLDIAKPAHHRPICMRWPICSTSVNQRRAMAPSFDATSLRASFAGWPAFAEQAGAAYFHPFADPAVVAGQGIAGLELFDALSDIDVLLVAIGGGGLISGLAVALEALKPSIRIIGIEPEGSPTLKAGLDAGRVLLLDKVISRVATMSCAETDQCVFEMVRDNIDDVVLVSDDAMLDAARWLWFEMGIAADLSGAAATAALRTKVITFSVNTVVGAWVCGVGPVGL